jgi:hypothetical protein
LANPASIPVTTLAANSAQARPAGSAIDTEAEVPVAAGGQGDILLEITNSAAANLTVSVRGGEYPLAFRSGLGDLSAVVAPSGVSLIGPLESARFMRSDDTIRLMFDAASGSPNATVRAYRMA